VVDSALARTARKKSEAAAAFEEHIRSSGSQVLVDVLRLGRYAREGAGGGASGAGSGRGSSGRA
jgi:hypothetical protein